MKLFSILLLLSAGVCMAQKDVCPEHSHYGGNLNCVADEGWVLKNANDRVWAEKIPPLKCGEYEHVEKEHVVADPNAHGYVEGFRIDKTPRCVPDLHTVTEKEWQEIMRRLKKLESK